MRIVSHLFKLQHHIYAQKRLCSNIVLGVGARPTQVASDPQFGTAGKMIALISNITSKLKTKQI